MTNIIKRKGLLFLMAVVVMIAMMSIACKNKATQPASFSVDGDVGDVVVDNPIEQPTTPETLTPDRAITIKQNYGIIQYGDAYFESAEYKTPNGTTFRYTVRFELQNDQFKTVLVKFSGYDKDGVKIDKVYSSGSYRKSSAEKQEYAPYQFGLEESSDLIIYKTGYLDFKPKGFNAHIKLALKNK